MTPEEVARYRFNIQYVIETACADLGIHSCGAAQVTMYKKEIWSALQESGVLHPLMTYKDFSIAIDQEHFFAITFNPNEPRIIKDVEVEMEDYVPES